MYDFGFVGLWRSICGAHRRSKTIKDQLGKPPRYTLDVADGSMFTEVSVMSIDDQTIYSPPLPVAASTVVRSEVNRCQDMPSVALPVQPNYPGKPRADYSDPKGSFLDNDLWPVTHFQPDDQMAGRVPVAHFSFSDHCRPVNVAGDQGYEKAWRNGVQSQPGQPAQTRDLVDRSSLGILSPEVMADNSFFDVEDVPISELLNFGGNGQNSRPTNQKQTSNVSSLSKDSRGADSSNEQPMTRPHAMGTVKKQRAVVQSEKPNGGSAVLSAMQMMLGSEGGGEDGEEPEASVCEVQFEDKELADLDDDFGDFCELQDDKPDTEYRAEEHFPAAAEDWFQYYCKGNNPDAESPVSIAFQDEECVLEDEPCPQEGPFAQSNSEDTEDELQAVRQAMRQSLDNDRQNGVGSSEELADPDDRPGLEGGSDHFPDSFTRPNAFARQSAEGEVFISPIPGDGGGGGDGSSAPGSEDERFLNDDAPMFLSRPSDSRNLHAPQGETRIRPVGDETRDSMATASMNNHPVLDSIHFKHVELTNIGDGDSQQMAFGLGEDSSYHFEDFLPSEPQQTAHSEHYQEERLEASGFCQVDFSFGRCSLGSFGASPDKDEQARSNFVPNDNKTDAQGCADYQFPEATGYQTNAVFDEVHVYEDKAAENRHVTQLKKAYVSSESPVYIDETGAGVTDLAFHTPFVNEAATQKQMFEEWAKDLPGEDPLAASICNEEEEFRAGSNVMMMLENDEKEFMQENVFIKDDQMEAGGQSYGDDSWIFQTSIYLANSMRQVDQPLPGDAYMRISIGEFMRGGSGALGSLSGDSAVERPNFGNKIITPPRDRAGVCLLKNTSNCEAPASETRQDGVGFDIQGSSAADKPMTMEDIDLQQKSPPGSSGYVSKDQIGQEGSQAKDVSGVLQKDLSHVDSLAMSTMSRLSEMSEMSGLLSLSAITNVLSAASPSCKREDLVNMVLALNAKSQEKKSKTESARTNLSPVVEKASEATGEKCRPKLQGSRLPVRTGSSSSPSDPSAQLHKKKSLDQAKLRKTSSPSSTPCNRSQPLGSTEPAFKPNQTVNVKKSSVLRHGSSGEPGAAAEEKELGGACTGGQPLSGPKPRPDGQEAGELHRAQSGGTTASPSSHSGSDSRHRVNGSGGGGGGGDSHPVSLTPGPKLSEMGTPAQLQSSVSVMKSDANSEFYSPRLSEIARNMTVDLSKVELPADFTLTEYIREENDRSYSPADGRDTTITKPVTQANPSSSDTHVFKKPEALPVRKTVPTVNKQDISKLGNNAKQSVPSKGKIQGKQGPNKENQLTANKPSIGNKSLGQASLRAKPGVKLPQNNLSPQTQISSQKRNLPVLRDKMGGDVTKSQPALRQNVTKLNTPPTVVADAQQKTKTYDHIPDQRPQDPNRAEHQTSQQHKQIQNQAGQLINQTSEHHTEVMNQISQPPAQMQNQPYQHSSQMRNQISQHPNQTSKQPSYVSQQTSQRPLHFAQPTSQHLHHQTLGPYSHLPHPAELHTPKNFSSMPHLGVNLYTPTPTKYPSLEDPSMVSFDHGLPAYQSTPFYHALSPHDASELADPTLEVGLVMKTPNIAKDFYRAAPGSMKMVEVPSVVNFSEVCCVGVSTKATVLVKNLSDHWQECVLDVRQLNLNGQSVDPQLSSPFMYTQKTIVEPLSSENISVIFVPKCAGTYVARMAVSACTVVQNNLAKGHNSQPEFVTLQACAEMANIEVVTESYLSLAFGELTWGSCKGLPLNLLNRGKATVPLRLSLSASNGGWHCFSFEEAPPNDLSVISGSNRPPTPALRKSVLNVTLNADSEPNCSSPLPLMVYCKLPEREASTACRKSIPETIQAKLEIEVDTPATKLLVGTVSLHAVAGEVKLLTSIGYEPFEITSYGERSTSAFKVHNSGNITMGLTVQPRDFGDVLKAVPANLTVKPGEFQEITAVFSPARHQPCVETVLLMAVEPDGPVYEVTLVARCLSKVTVPVQPDVQILSNKNFLSFGGTEIGKYRFQQLKLVHQAKTQVKLKLEMTSAAFQIKTLLNQTETFSSMKEVFVKPREEYIVNLAFCPTAATQFQGKIVIRQDGSKKKFSVPLSGHGGTSNLVLEDSTDSARAGNYYRNIGQMKIGENNVQEITVCNVGSRAAFVKVFCFADLSCSQMLNNNVAVVLPNEFVIKANSLETLVLVLNPSPIQAARCQNKRSVVGVLKFYYGDEITRRLYRRGLRENPGVTRPSFPKNHLLSKVNFNVDMKGEADIEEGCDMFATSPNDQFTFVKGISRVVLSLVGEPPAPEMDQGMEHIETGPYSQTSRGKLPALSYDSSSDMPALKLDNSDGSQKTGGGPLNHDLDVSVLPSKRDVVAGSKLYHTNLQNGQKQGQTTDSLKGFILESDKSSKQVYHINSLEIFPKEITLDMREDGSCVKKGCVRIKNLTDVQRSFTVSWPAKGLDVQFDSWVLQPREMSCLYVSPRPFLLSDEITLPWSVRIRVDSESESQMVSVLVRRSAEEQKVINVDSPVLSGHGETVPSTVQTRGKGEGVAAQINSQKKIQSPSLNTKQKPSQKESVSQSSGKGDSCGQYSTRTPPMQLISRSGHITSSCNSDPAPTTRRTGHPAVNSPLVTKSKSTSQSPQPLGTISQNIARQSPSESSQLKKAGQKCKFQSPAEEQVIFAASRVGESTETTFSLSNPTDPSIIWTLSPFTPPFLKIPESAESASKVQRVGYDVFKFTRTSGDLQPQETMQIFVQFEPQDVGYFSQFWEVRKTRDGSCEQTIDRVQLLAEALPASSPRVTSLQDQYPASADTSVSSDKSRQPQQTRTLQDTCVIRLLTDTLEFAAWGPRQTEECKAQIKNKDSVLHRIEIIPPQEPFYLNRTAVKIRGGHFVKLPIEFRPRKIGSYEGIVVFRPDVGQSLSLKLKGTCR